MNCISCCCCIQPFFTRLASHNIEVKNLQALGNLGSINNILTNKTGTITQGSMTVTHVFLDNKIEECSIHSGSEWKVRRSPSWKVLERAAVLCNSAEFTEGQAGIEANKRSCIGNATDAAILKVTAVTTNDIVMEYRKKCKKVGEIAFNSSDMFHVSIHQVEDASEVGYLLVMKGAPEKILECCSTVLVDGTDKPLNKQLKRDIEDAIKELASRDTGERVIGFCDFVLPSNEYPIGYDFDADKVNWPKLTILTQKSTTEYINGFRFVGMMAMADPPRDGVCEAICKFRSREHGIKTVMVTGDHPVTAKTIAKSVGIICEGNKTAEDISEELGISVDEINPRDASAMVLDGKSLKHYNVDEIREVVVHHTDIVFARVTPQQKLWIVEAFKSFGAEYGLVVAFVGNDTAALKAADVGIAMGASLGPSADDLKNDVGTAVGAPSADALKNDVGIAVGAPSADALKNAADMILVDDNFANIVYGVEVAKDMPSIYKKLPTWFQLHIGPK